MGGEGQMLVSTVTCRSTPSKADGTIPYDHNGHVANHRKVQSNNYNVSVENTRDDLTKDRPLYPFSCYGPGVNAPKQLIEGHLEQSPEEMRVQAYLAQSNGQIEQYVSGSCSFACITTFTDLTPESPRAAAPK